MNRRDFVRIAGNAGLAVPLLSGCSSLRSAGNGPVPVATPEQREAYTRRLLKEWVTDVGPHPVGTPSCQKVEAGIVREMKRSLPIVETDPITFERWAIKGNPEFVVGDRRIEVVPAHGAGSTPGTVSGILKKSTARGAACDLVDPSSGKLLGHILESSKQHPTARPWWMFYEQPGGMAMVCVGKRDFPAVTEAVEKGTPVRMNVQVEFFPGNTTTNVIGTLPGESTDEIVFYAHHDTVWNAPGANDNIASLIMVLLVAHSFAGTRPKKTLTFMATTGEEYGWMGTKHLAKTWKASGRLDRIKCIVCFDSITWGPAPTLITDDEASVKLITAISKELNLPGETDWRKSSGMGRETAPLLQAGLKARNIVCDSVPDNYVNELCWLSPEDKAEHVRTDLVEVFYKRFREYMLRVQDMV
jgi:hypothetical protein